MAKEQRFTFDATNGLDRMIHQRAKQEGVTVSEYIREAIILEMFFSGDIEATKFVLQRVGKRMKSMLIDRIAGVDLKERVEALSG